MGVEKHLFFIKRIMDQLLIRYFAFIRYRKRTMGHYITYLWNERKLMIQFEEEYCSTVQHSC